jgi:hypothetical protein
MNQEISNQQTEKETTTVAELPFNIRFSYGGKSTNISLLKGDDVFKLAKLFENILTENGIEYDVEVLNEEILKESDISNKEHLGAYSIPIKGNAAELPTTTGNFTVKHK